MEDKDTEAGIASAELNLANRYFNSAGVQEDVDKALRLFKSAADRGNSEAAFNLGWLGLLDTSNSARVAFAIEYLIMAADRGYARAALHLGKCYKDGIGVNKDLTKAAQLFGQASRHLEDLSDLGD
jgi:TPR repeat protein